MKSHGFLKNGVCRYGSRACSVGRALREGKKKRCGIFISLIRQEGNSTSLSATPEGKKGEKLRHRFVRNGNAGKKGW